MCVYEFTRWKIEFFSLIVVMAKVSSIWYSRRINGDGKYKYQESGRRWLVYGEMSFVDDGSCCFLGWETPNSKYFGELLLEEKHLQKICCENLWFRFSSSECSTFGRNPKMMMVNERQQNAFLRRSMWCWDETNVKERKKLK